MTVLSLAAPGPAHAGRSFFGWLVGSEVMPERSVIAVSQIKDAPRVQWGIAF